MPSLTRIFENGSSPLGASAQERLHQLIGDWQLLADIAFSDLFLYVRSGATYVVGAQTRPATAATLFDADFVGRVIEPDFEEVLQAVVTTGEVLATENDDDAIDTWVPVPWEGEIIAVMRVVTALAPDRVPSQSHEDYERVAELLMQMVADGAFPIDGAPSSYRPGTPRVADGVVFLACDGSVIYASPNAVTNFRRYGVVRPMVGNVLAELVAEKFDESVVPDETLPLVLLGKAAWITELESKDVTVSLRAVPLMEGGERKGALLLTRDVTRMRRSEREIMSKDATIKEINHRVKNNLQTVSALLRMQGRRATNEETRAALADAQRRVEMIAIVHERLSQTIDEVVEFDEVFGSLLRTVRDVAVTDHPVDIAFSGSFGRVRAEQATALAVVLNEVISNAIEHGLDECGKVEVRSVRDGYRLVVEVEDNGEGLHGSAPTPGISSITQPKGRDSGGLGTQIVRTLVGSELDGRISWRDAEPHGAIVRIEANLRS